MILFGKEVVVQEDGMDIGPIVGMILRRQEYLFILIKITQDIFHNLILPIQVLIGVQTFMVITAMAEIGMMIMI